MSLRCVGEVELADLDLELGRFGIAAFVEGSGHLCGIFGSAVHFLQQFEPLELGGAAHVVPLIRVEYFELVDLASGSFQLDPFAEGIEVGGMALLHDDLNHVFSLKFLLAEHWHELHRHFLPAVEVHSRVHLLQQRLQEQFEGVLLFALEHLSLDCALAVLNSDVDDSSAGVEEGDDGLEQCPFGLFVLERQCEVFVLGGEVLQLVPFSLVEGSPAPHAVSLLHRDYNQTIYL